MKINLLFLLLILCLPGCNGQNARQGTISTGHNKIVGGGCDGCELMFEGIPASLVAVDTSDGWNEAGKRLVVEGTVFKLDGATPAKDVIIYYWQTDNNGKYSKTADEQSVHGHLRGWIKSGADGKFRINTIRPVSYPNSSIPAHIHFSIKEPDIANEYYIDDVQFDDDRFLTASERKKLENRGGNGIGKVTVRDSVQIIRRDIILGQNIPNYPQD